MDSFLSFIQDHNAIVKAISIISLLSFLASLLIVPVIVCRLPDNYFTLKARQKRQTAKPPSLLETLLVALKNIIGVLLIIAGIAMLILPGQGLLAILIGLSITNFPGKYRLQRKLVGHPGLFKTLNWIRHKAGKNSLDQPN